MSAPFARIAVKKASLEGQTPAKRPSFHRDAFLRAGIAHDGHAEGAFGDDMRLDGGSVRVRFEQGNTRAQPDGGDAFGMEKGHATAPVAATAVSPERPGHRGELGMSARRTEIGEGFWKAAASDPLRGSHHIWQSAFSGCS
jgi:hypothetical protein